MRKLKCGIVGFGISAKAYHIPFLTTMEEFELACVVERSGNEVQQRLPAVRSVRSIDELLADQSIDLVVITTPNETHFPFAVQCLKAGKHVVVEKPFTNTSKEAETLVNLANSGDQVLSVYQNRRYVSDFLTIKEILDKRLLGEVHEFESHYDRYRPEARPAAWREAPLPGSGIFYDLGPHLLDQVCCLFGLPSAITADITSQRPHSRVDDFFNLWLHYPFGKVILHAGMLIREPGPRYMVHGTKGSYIKYGEDVQEAKLRGGELPTQADWGREPENIFGLLHTLEDGELIKEKYPSLPGNYGLYYKNLYDTIVNGHLSKERPEHGYNTIRLIELAFESAENRCMLDCAGLMDVPYP
ncbi:MAG: oxidoreductase [Chitinophagaceae bacterium]